MSRTNPNIQEQRELTVPCSKCGSEAGKWCRSLGFGRGGWAQHLHQARWNAWVKTPEAQREIAMENLQDQLDRMEKVMAIAAQSGLIVRARDA